jgi:hypothetical protein
MEHKLRNVDQSGRSDVRIIIPLHHLWFEHDLRANAFG